MEVDCGGNVYAAAPEDGEEERSESHRSSRARCASISAGLPVFSPGLDGDSELLDQGASIVGDRCLDRESDEGVPLATLNAGLVGLSLLPSVRSPPCPVPFPRISKLPLLSKLPLDAASPPLNGPPLLKLE